MGTLAVGVPSTISPPAEGRDRDVRPSRTLVRAGIPTAADRGARWAWLCRRDSGAHADASPSPLPRARRRLFQIRRSPVPRAAAMLGRGNTTLTHEAISGQLCWSEYKGFLWCPVCDHDYPSAVCAAPDQSAEVFLNTVEHAVRRALAAHDVAASSIELWCSNPQGWPATTPRRTCEENETGQLTRCRPPADAEDPSRSLPQTPPGSQPTAALWVRSSSFLGQRSRPGRGRDSENGPTFSLGASGPAATGRSGVSHDAGLPRQRPAGSKEEAAHRVAARWAAAAAGPDVRTACNTPLKYQKEYRNGQHYARHRREQEVAVTTCAVQVSALARARLR